MPTFQEQLKIIETRRQTLADASAQYYKAKLELQRETGPTPPDKTPRELLPAEVKKVAKARTDLINAIKTLHDDQGGLTALTANLDELKRYLEMRAPGLLPAGQKLSVTLTDVDMAGEYEPWQQPGVNDVRIVKDLYPPRIDLEFKVTDAAGAVVKEGKRQLRDLSFMMKLSLRRDDPHRYEKALLDDWLRKDLPPAK